MYEYQVTWLYPQKQGDEWARTLTEALHPATQGYRLASTSGISAVGGGGMSIGTVAYICLFWEREKK